MARVTFGMLLLLAAITGCQPAQEPVDYVDDSPGPEGYSTALLFNRDPGLASASHYAARSDWPGVTSPLTPGEAVFYRERFIDWQGPGRTGRDMTYRRFETYRTGYRRP